ncbi:hypothetical protein V6N13_086986 [Hibiscus sabdariffa]
MDEILKATRNFNTAFKVGQGGFGTVYKGKLDGGSLVAIKQHGDERILVMEYVPNGTLREQLDGVNGKELDFAARLDIAIDVAHAITYLHMYTGRRPIESKRELKERITPRWAMKKFTDGVAISALDPRLEPTAAEPDEYEEVWRGVMEHP